MNPVKLLIHPDVVGTDRQPYTHPDTKVVKVQFGYYSADDTGPAAPRCDRCNVLLHQHEYQFVDGNTVIDCGRTL